MATADTRAAGGDVAAHLQGRRRAATAGTSSGRHARARRIADAQARGVVGGVDEAAAVGEGREEGWRCEILRRAYSAGRGEQCVWA